MVEWTMISWEDIEEAYKQLIQNGRRMPVRRRVANLLLTLRQEREELLLRLRGRDKDDY